MLSEGRRRMAFRNGDVQTGTIIVDHVEATNILEQEHGRGRSPLLEKACLISFD